MTTILITGGAGFIAHHTIKEILDKTDWNIISLDRLDFSGNLNRLYDMLKDHNQKHRVKIVYHDLKAEINQTTSNLIGNVDYILHMAANPHVDKSIKDPLGTVLDNVVGTCNILNFARTQMPILKRFIYFSTDEVFGPTPPNVDFTEYSRYNSKNPYSASKAGGEELSVAFHNTYKLPVYIIHSMNVFGERQQAAAFIPICIRKILNDEELTIHSDRTLTKIPTRKYVHALDVASAILILLQQESHLVDTLDEGLVKVPKFNIAGMEKIDILTIAKTIAECIGKPLKYKISSSDRPGTDLDYSLSGSRLTNLGWYPKIPFKESIPSIVSWYTKNKEWIN